MTDETYCGFITLLGRPNVGKSTLLNHLLGEKISITSRKPQTTRHRITGIKTEGNIQAIYVDTPGVHLNPKTKMNEMMVRTALATLNEVDVVLFVIDVRAWMPEDELVLEKIKQSSKPVFVVLNKIDLLQERAQVLPRIQAIHEHLQGIKILEIVPVSAKQNQNLDRLQELINQHLPQSPYMYDPDQLCDRSERFLAAEIIREKLMRLLGDEIPHELAVEIERYKYENNCLHIHALIWVTRDGQKKIVIGKEGSMLKKIGKVAREDLEKSFDTKVFLKLWVKVKSGWNDDERALLSLGYWEG